MNLIKRSPILYLILLIQFISCSQQPHSTRHILLEFWKFKIGDNPEYAKPNYNDLKWDSIGTDRYWESQGYPNYDGFAWYRTNVFIPSSLKRNLLNDSVCVFLGKIDDCDQVYLNGTVLGQNNKHLPQNTIPDTSFISAGSNQIASKYVVSASDTRILWDKENTICVRVYDKGGHGGIKSNMIPYIGMKGFDSDVLINNEKFYSVDESGNVDTSIVISNTSNRNLQGTLFIYGENLLTKMPIFKTSHEVKLNIGQKKTEPVSLPICTDPIIVTFAYDNEGSKITTFNFFVQYSLVRSKNLTSHK